MEPVYRICKSVLVAALMMATVSAWGGDKRSLHLEYPTNVAGKTLPTGNYNVRWEATGNQVQLEIYQGNKKVASVPASVVQLNSPAAYDSAVLSNVSGTTSLAEIRFGGRKFALRIAGEGGGGAASTAAK